MVWHAHENSKSLNIIHVFGTVTIFHDCSQVPQYYYSVCDDDFQLLLDRLALGGGGSRSMPPTPAVGFSGRSTSPWCGPHHRRHQQQRLQVPLAVVVDGSSLDQFRQSTSLSSSTSSTRCIGAICPDDDAAAAWSASGLRKRAGTMSERARSADERHQRCRTSGRRRRDFIACPGDQRRLGHRKDNVGHQRRQTELVVHSWTSTRLL
jgi:hypothetical protein